MLNFAMVLYCSFLCGVNAYVIVEGVRSKRNAALFFGVSGFVLSLSLIALFTAAEIRENAAKEAATTPEGQK